VPCFCRDGITGALPDVTSWLSSYTSIRNYLLKMIKMIQSLIITKISGIHLKITCYGMSRENDSRNGKRLQVPTEINRCGHSLTSILSNCHKNTSVSNCNALETK
jgi:phage-related protein